MPQPQETQQSRLDDIQMLQRQIMFKQLQELQRRQQFQELGDPTRRQNYANQLSMMNKQASGPQFPPLVNGTPIRNPSQMFMMQRGPLPVGQGFLNGITFSQAPSQSMPSMGFASQQPDLSLYGTPIENNASQYSHLHVSPHDSSSVLTKGNSYQTEKPIMQSSSLRNSFMSGHHNVSSNQVGMMDGGYASKQAFEQNLFGQVPTQGLNSDVGLFLGKTTNSAPSQGLASLDPLEQKVLFNLDDGDWEASFGRRSNTDTRGLEKSLVNTDHLSAFPSVQSGSWSALMQSAVAEASSSDTGLQEEWSGLSFQNPEQSTDNQPSNFIDSGGQQPNWVDSNLQSALSNSNSSNFPVFQQPGIQFSLIQKDGMNFDTSHASIRDSPKNDRKWFNSNPQHEKPIEERQPVQRISPLQSSWPGQTTQWNHFSPVPNSSATNVDYTVDQESSRRVLESHQLDYMKCGAVSVEDGNMGNYQCQLNNSPQILRQSNKGASESYEKLDNCFHRENSVDSYHSNTPLHSITGCKFRENFWLHESDSQPVAEGNQTPSSQVSPGLSDHEQGYVGQFKYIDNVSYSGMDLEKGHLPNTQRNLKGSEDLPPRSNVGSSTSSFSERSAGFDGPNVTAQTSQNMLELLHKVDRTTVYRPGMHVGSIDSTSSGGPQAESPEAFVAQSYNKFSASQYFGLRLAPPSQRLPNPNCSDSSQSSPQAGNSAANFIMQGNSGATFPSGPHVRNQNQTQNQLQPDAFVANQSSQPTVAGMGSRFPGFNPTTSHRYGQQFPIVGLEPVTQPSVTSAMSQQVGFSMRPPNVWSYVPTQQNLSGTESHKVPFNSLPSPDSTNSSLETASGAPQELQSQPHFKGGSNSLDRERHNDNQAPDISARDFEAFGRSLRPSHPPNQNYSRLHQMQSVKNVETDMSKRVSDRYSGVDSDMNVQRVTAISGQQSLYGQNAGVRNLLNSDTFEKMVKFSQNDSQRHSISSSLAPNKPQQAPSWLQNYATLKNGQMMSVYDARVAENAAHQFSFGKPPANLGLNSSTVVLNSAGVGQTSSVWPTVATTSIADTHLSPHYSLISNVTDKSSSVSRPKKRKIAPFELLSWHKEVTQGLLRVQNISMAELEWAQAANQLIEKVGHDTETIKDRPTIRAKKRLILTTHLMQQLFRPAPAVILSEDATSTCESVAYFSARLALGDACSLASNSHMPCGISDMSCKKPKPSERHDDRDFSTIVEGFITRTKRLEGDLLRLEKSSSILDTTVESQELEKFSVINHFAKFHTRGSEALTSLTLQKTVFQRYVTANPMPTSVPDQTQCLSL